MSSTVVNTIFTSSFLIHGETAATVSAVILDDLDVQVAIKVLPKRESGYLFSHVFTSTGYFTVKVTDSFGGHHYDAVTVSLSVLDEIA